MRCGSGIHGPKRMNSNGFGVPLAFSFSTPQPTHVYISTDICKNLLILPILPLAKGHKENTTMTIHLISYSQRNFNNVCMFNIQLKPMQFNTMSLHYILT